jgi:4'-phosphopantetheinyl transferase
VWSVSLDLPELIINKLLTTLQQDEQRRAARFARPSLQNHFIAGRGALRSILARYLGVKPAEVEFQYSAYGKPRLAPTFEASGLHFNLSHSAEMAMVAIADREVGADIERPHPISSMARLVERFFAAEEYDEWQRLSADVQQLGFFQAWTRKEAWLKATGSGLSFPLNQVRVSLAPGEPARFVSIGGDPAQAAAWWLESCEPAPGYLAAIAMRGEPTRIERWQWRL